LPGVAAAAQARITPLEDSHTGTKFLIQDELRSVEINRVSPEFFSVLGIAIVRGRNFTSAETGNAAPVAIVTESTGRRLWPGQDPLGKTLRDPAERLEREVIGIAHDAQVSKIGSSDTVYVYLPVSPDWQRQMQWLIRCTGSHATAAAAIRTAVASLDPALLITVAPLEDNLELWRLLSRIVSGLAGALGILALLLASVGIYGVVAFVVSRRVREIGIRMALGADAGTILKMILKQAIRPIAIGAVLGVLGCAALSRLLSSMLFGVSAYDPLAFAGVPLLLAGIAFLASYVPARRAMKIDPAAALRSE
jgi:predicted permease